MSRRKFYTRAFVALVGVVVLSQCVELVINRVLRPDLREWSWISDVILIVALLVLTILWGRLSLARTVIATLERERLTMQAELAVAAKVQRALLPPLPATLHGISWHAAMEPAGQVGGDYYDFFPLGGDRLCVVLADVSGKGVPAAVFVSNTRAVLRAVARGGATPAAMLAQVSEILMQDGRAELYVTCFVAIVDTIARTMVYTNAGHPPGLLLGPAGPARALTVGGPPLGLLPAARYDEERIALGAGDLVVLVSDGVTDAIDASGADIPAQLGARIRQLRDDAPAAVCAALLSAARQSAGPHGVANWDDDRTVVAFAVAPSH